MTNFVVVTAMCLMVAACSDTLSSRQRDEVSDIAADVADASVSESAKVAELNDTVSDLESRVADLESRLGM